MELTDLIKELATIITSCGTILFFLQKYFIKPVNSKIDNLELSTIRTSLVDFLSEVEDGQVKDPIRIKNAYDLYDRYKILGGNSYVHDKWEKLKKEGKI